MNDNISRQAAIETLEQGKDKTAKGNIGGFYNAIIQKNINRLIRLPSADVVEVVRCRDCARYDTHNKRCKYWNHGVGVDLDGFCSKGVRTDD